MKGMRVVFRVDGASEIGAGHTMRCLTLADLLRGQGADCHFVCRPHPGNLIGMIEGRGYAVSVLPPPEANPDPEEAPYAAWLGAAWNIDADQTRAVVGNTPVDWLVVDHYGIDSRWETALRGQCDRLMVIDDLADRPHDCDVLLDQTLGRSAAEYGGLVPSACHVLVGTEYALLRPQFAQARFLRRGRRRDHLASILVCLGGTDPHALTGAVLEGIRQSGLDVTMDVVAGGNPPSWISEEGRIRWRRHVDDMASLLNVADLAVGAAGTSSWERCCLGVPTLLVVAADNQRAGAAALVDAGAVRLLGDWAAVSPESVASAVRELAVSPTDLVRMRQAASGLCDGLGGGRVLGEMSPVRLPDGAAVTLRRVTPADRDRILAWQSEPEARRYARNPKVPSAAEHGHWFEAKCAQADASLEIVLVDDAPVGMVRLDAAGQDRLEVSILIASTGRGRGIGTAALVLLARLAPWADLLAEVDPENAASRRAFLRAGYESVDERHLVLHRRVSFPDSAERMRT